ncbi:unnamed protein product [Brassica oleracea var. botrytis]|uniref:(rape) hypothetical protein n=1 Tax=Brassica napus TaxID=3708 RepID=A0A816MF60_BRANA|nr:unnamed protein product [Brassica napus]
MEQINKLNSMKNKIDDILSETFYITLILLHFPDVNIHMSPNRDFSIIQWLTIFVPTKHSLSVDYGEFSSFSFRVEGRLV